MNNWKDEDVVHHSNTQASTMAVDVVGHLVVLGSRRCLTVLELNDPQKVVHRKHLPNKWDISNMLWNPSPSQSNLLLTTYNQWADLWQLDDRGAKCVVTLKGHTRAISDIDWSVMNPNLAATCSLDTYIFLWDMRNMKQPKLSTSTVSGSSQVKWNKQNEHVLATAHDGNIRLWDIRNIKTPTHYITAHLSKINHLDWSPKNEHSLASGGQDATIKFWDTTELPRTASAQIALKYPLWKLSHTPFGEGLLSIEYANFRETPLTLWDTTKCESIRTFTDHSDVILGYQCCRIRSAWRLVTWTKDQVLRINRLDDEVLLRSGLAKDTLNKVEDDDLHLFAQDGKEDSQTTRTPTISQTYQSSNSSAESNLSQLSGSMRGSSFPQLSGFRGIDHRDIFESGFSDLSPTSMQYSSGGAAMPSLEQEFKLLNVSLPNLQMEKVDLPRRECTVSLRTPIQFVVINITFPSNYPHNESPNFVFVKTNVEQKSLAKLKSTLQDTAHHHVRNGRSCLEPCLRQLTALFSDMSYQDEDDDPMETFDPPSMFPHPLRSSLFPDLHHIPFPRTSGARFCGVGYLVVFMRPEHVRGFESSNEKTPRSISYLTATHRSSTSSLYSSYRNSTASLAPFSSSQGMYGSSPTQVEHAAHTFYYKEKRTSRKLKHFSYSAAFGKEPDASLNSSNLESKPFRPQQYAGRVQVLDLTRILPISKELAEEYMIPTEENFVPACWFNQKASTDKEMVDLVELWKCVSLLPRPDVTKGFNEMSIPFSQTPMGKLCLSKLIEHYCKQNDVQTLAMLVCSFTTFPRRVKETEPDTKPKSPFDIKRSASYGTFQSSQRTEVASPKVPKEKSSESQGISSFIYSIVTRSPPTGPSYMEQARSLVERPVEKPTTLEQPPKLPALPDLKQQAALQMLDAGRTIQFDSFKKAYASLLDRWKFHNQKKSIEKYVTNKTRMHRGLDFNPGCASCGEVCKSFKCSTSRKKFAYCVVCELPVRGRVTFCFKCKHGGHIEHLKMWFAKQKTCPSTTGCDCQCVNLDSTNAVPV